MASSPAVELLPLSFRYRLVQLEARVGLDSRMPLFPQTAESARVEVSRVDVVKMFPKPRVSSEKK